MTTLEKAENDIKRIEEDFKKAETAFPKATKETIGQILETVHGTVKLHAEKYKKEFEAYTALNPADQKSAYNDVHNAYANQTFMKTSYEHMRNAAQGYFNQPQLGTGTKFPPIPDLKPPTVVKGAGSAQNSQPLSPFKTKTIEEYKKQLATGAGQVNKPVERGGDSPNKTRLENLQTVPRGFEEQSKQIKDTASDTIAKDLSELNSDYDNKSKEVINTLKTLQDADAEDVTKALVAESGLISSYSKKAKDATNVISEVRSELASEKEKVKQAQEELKKVREEMAALNTESGDKYTREEVEETMRKQIMEVEKQINSLLGAVTQIELVRGLFDAIVQQYSKVYEKAMDSSLTPKKISEYEMLTKQLLAKLDSVETTGVAITAEQVLKELKDLVKPTKTTIPRSELSKATTVSGNINKAK